MLLKLVVVVASTLVQSRCQGRTGQFLTNYRQPSPTLCTDLEHNKAFKPKTAITLNQLLASMELSRQFNPR